MFLILNIYCVRGLNYLVFILIEQTCPASTMSNLVMFPSLSRKIVAVGRNYAEHAAELGNAVPSKPLLFMKVR